jgi:predicted phosphodiesterase
VRYAILSDVHGNLESLERALSMLTADDVVVSLGDVVGYGPNPNECVATLRKRARHAVLGNHDLAAVENFGVENFNHAARAAIGWTQGVLDDASRVFRISCSSTAHQ